MFGLKNDYSFKGNECRKIRRDYVGKVVPPEWFEFFVMQEPLFSDHANIWTLDLME
jgi:hypothetical protein